ncbi:hypothetical protein ACHAXR_010876 [Thalassiosira sp. AJA248-18]
MKPQHFFSAAAIVAAQAPLVGAFSSIGGASTSRVAGSRRSRSRSSSELQSSSIDAQAISELESLISDLMEVNRGAQHGNLQGLSPGRSAPSPLTMAEAAAGHGMPWTTTIGRTDEENPLLYMPFWDWQLDFMESSLTNLHPIECTTLNDIDVSFNENKEKRARIVNHCYASDEYRKIRMTYYDAGDSVQVFNSVFYPDAKYNLPVLGIDLLSFNRKKYLAIVDFQPLHQDEDDHAMTYEHILQPIKDKYDNLKGRMSSKFYDETQFFSKEMLFARFEGQDCRGGSLPCLQITHLDLVKNTPAATSPQDVQHVFDRQTAYDTYSAERDPAAGLFSAMFGKEWAEDFIYDFLFSLSERSEEGLNLSPPMFGGPPQGGKPGGPGGPPAHGGAPAKKEASKTHSMPRV